MRLELVYLDYIIDRATTVGEAEGIRLLHLQRGYNIPRSTHYQAMRELIAIGFVQRVGADRYWLSRSFVERVNRKVC